MAREHWRQIKGYKRFYLISDRGRVKSVHYGREKLLKQSMNHCGQAVVCLCSYGRKNTVAVQLLVKNNF